MKIIFVIILIFSLCICSITAQETLTVKQLEEKIQQLKTQNSQLQQELLKEFQKRKELVDRFFTRNQPMQTGKFINQVSPFLAVKFELMTHHQLKLSEKELYKNAFEYVLLQNPDLFEKKQIKNKQKLYRNIVFVLAGPNWGKGLIFSHQKRAYVLTVKHINPQKIRCFVSQKKNYCDLLIKKSFYSEKYDLALHELECPENIIPQLLSFKKLLFSSHKEPFILIGHLKRKKWFIDIPHTGIIFARKKPFLFLFADGKPGFSGSILFSLKKKQTTIIGMYTSGTKNYFGVALDANIIKTFIEGNICKK